MKSPEIFFAILCNPLKFFRSKIEGFLEYNGTRKLNGGRELTLFFLLL